MNSPPRRGIRVSLSILVAVLLGACGGSVPGPEQVARSFVEAYYVRADLIAASGLAGGLAREKIERQAKLRKAPTGGGAGPTAPGLSKRRSVKYEILETRERTDGSRIYRLRLTISSSPMTLNVETLVTVGQRGKADRRRWVVLNFMDLGASVK